MARVNKSQFAILGCLTIRPMSAYEMKAFMARTTQFFWTEREGQLYPTLRKLGELSWVTYVEEPAAKVGTKKIYTITESGRAAFDNWFAGETALPVERNEVLLKIFFAKSQSQSAVNKVLEDALAMYEDHLEVLHSAGDFLSERKQAGVNTRFYDMVLDHGIATTEAEITWAKKYLS